MTINNEQTLDLFLRKNDMFKVVRIFDKDN